MTGSDVDRFHRETYRDNIFLILSTKLIIIMIIGTVSTLITSIMFVFATYSALLLDSFFNILLLWLNFKFSIKWFKLLRCGYPMRWIFPTIKTVSLISRNHLGNCCYLFCCCCLCCVGKSKIDIPKHSYHKRSKSASSTKPNRKRTRTKSNPSKDSLKPTKGKHVVVVSGSIGGESIGEAKIDYKPQTAHQSTNTLSSVKSIDISISFNRVPSPPPISKRLSNKIQISSYNVDTATSKHNNINLGNSKMNETVSLETVDDDVAVDIEHDIDLNDEVDLSVSKLVNEEAIDLSVLESPNGHHHNESSLYISPRSINDNYLHSPPNSRQGSRKNSVSFELSATIPKIKPKLSIEYSNSKILNDETEVERRYCCTCCCTETGKNLWILARNEYDHFIKYKHN